MRPVAACSPPYARDSYFDKNLDGKVSYRELCSALATDAYQTEADQHYSIPATASPAVDVDYKAQAQEAQAVADEKNKTANVVEAFVAAFYSKNKELRKTFRLFDRTYSTRNPSHQ